MKIDPSTCKPIFLLTGLFLTEQIAKLLEKYPHEFAHVDADHITEAY